MGRTFHIRPQRMITNAAHRGIVLSGALVAAVACQMGDNEHLGEVRRPSIGGIDDIASMDVTADGDRLHALLSATMPQHTTAAVVYTSSNDHGATWSTPVPLGQRGDPAPIAGHGNEVQIAADGPNLVAVWQGAGAVPGTGPMIVAFSRDGGTSWSRGANPATGDLTNNQSYMDLTADDDGLFHLVWLDDRDENGNSQGLRYARSLDQGETWHAETTLDATACTCCWNRVAALPGDGIVVLYRDQEPHDMRLSRSEDGGTSWQPMSAVGDFGWHFSGCPHCGGALAIASQGDRATLHSIVWTGRTDAAGLYYLSSADLGHSWSSPRAIGTSRSRRADLAAASGELAAVFADVAAQAAAVSFIRSGDAGRTWSQPRLLTQTAETSGQPRVLATTDGFQAFWTEKDSAGRDILATAHLN
ncbi:sialidase family protein [Methylolobus aquaticus]